MSVPRRPRLGLALGAGSARGWAHVGVIRELEAAGIRPDLVCGTSVGALVAAVYAAGELDPFEEWLLGLGFRDVVALMDVGLGGGLLKGERLMDRFRENFADRSIAELPMPFGAVATSLRTGGEIWLREGSVIDAVRASIALPGLFAPALHEGEVLVDGGLANPVPVSLARAMGAELVIAVDLTSDVLGRHLHPNAPADEPAPESGDWMRRLRDYVAGFLPSRTNAEPRMPSVLEVLTSSINIMQVRIARSRMAGDPPELVIAPRLSHLGPLEYHRAKEAIEEGRHAVERVAHSLSAFGDQLP